MTLKKSSSFIRTKSVLKLEKNSIEILKELLDAK